MSAFHDVRFPLAIGLLARGGPRRKTEITPLASGREARNSPWAHSRRAWDAAPGVRSLEDAATLIAFFEARRGRLHAFRFADPLDHKSCAPGAEPEPGDQSLGVGDGVRTVFPLVKRYGDGAGAWVRPIPKPVAGTLVAAVNGVAQAAILGAQGRAVFALAPPSGASVTAGFRFDAPARFDADRLEMSLEGFGAADVGPVPLVEVLV